MVTFTDPETAQPLASNISKQGKTTMVTAFVPSFSDIRVDGDPGAWGDLAPLVPDGDTTVDGDPGAGDDLAPLVPDGDTTVDGDPGAGDDLAPLVPDYRFALAVNGTAKQKVQKVNMALRADGMLTSKSRVAMTAFSRMRGRLDMSLVAWVLVATLKSKKLKGEAKLDECWVQVANRKKGTFGCAAPAACPSRGRPLVPDGDTTVDGDPGAGDDLAPLVPDYRFALAVNGTANQKVQQVNMALRADGMLTSKSRVAMTAFSRMRGRLDMSLVAWVLGATLKGKKLKGEAELDQWWVQVVDRKKGTFWLHGTGPMRMEGAMKGAGWIRDSFTENLVADARIGVKTNAVPAKVGASVPVTFTIYWKGGVFQYEATLTRVSN